MHFTSHRRAFVSGEINSLSLILIKCSLRKFLPPAKLEQKTYINSDNTSLHSLLKEYPGFFAVLHSSKLFRCNLYPASIAHNVRFLNSAHGQLMHGAQVICLVKERPIFTKLNICLYTVLNGLSNRQSRKINSVYTSNPAIWISNKFPHNKIDMYFHNVQQTDVDRSGAQGRENLYTGSTQGLLGYQNLHDTKVIRCLLHTY